jgi:hypothetical protein
VPRAEGPWHLMPDDYLRFRGPDDFEGAFVPAIGRYGVEWGDRQVRVAVGTSDMASTRASLAQRHAKQTNPGMEVTVPARFRTSSRSRWDPEKWAGTTR